MSRFEYHPRIGRSARTVTWIFTATLLLGSCLGPTELRLHLRTNVPCTDPKHWHGVAVYVGHPGEELESKAPDTGSTTCDAQGDIGTLTVVPSGAKDEEIGVRVVAGVARNPEDCAENHYEGCIVTRRALHFNRHEATDLTMQLTSDCVSQGCDPTSTCVNSSCADVRAPAPPTNNIAGPSVRCGDNGVVCPTSGKVCCLTVDVEAGTTTGECKDSAACPATSIVLNCDDESDCARSADDAGHPGMCLLSYEHSSGKFDPTRVTSSQCLDFAGYQAAASTGLELCEDRKPCWRSERQCAPSNGVTPTSNPLPHYYWCVLDLVQ